MSNVKDVDIVITRETKAVSQSVFGVPLIFATDMARPYKEYYEISEVGQDYGETTAAYKMASRIFGQTPRPAKIAMFGVQYVAPATPEALVAALNELVENHNDFYFLLCDKATKPEILALAEWIDTQKKMYFSDTTDLTLFTEMNSDRTVLIYHNDPEQYVAAGWVGRCAPAVPGSLTWKFKTINGVSESDIGATELNQIHQNGGNAYIKKLGVLQTSEGLTTSGEYIDVIQSQDYVEARISENVHFLLFNSDKVPYDNAGIALIAGQIREVLQQATKQGIIAKDKNGDGIWSITAPRREDIPASQRATRELPDIHFDFELSGAVHKVKVRGTIRV